MHSLKDSIELIHTLAKPTIPLAIYITYLHNAENDKGRLICSLSANKLAAVMKRDLASVYAYRKKLIGLGLVECFSTHTIIYMFTNKGKRFSSIHVSDVAHCIGFSGAVDQSASSVHSKQPIIIISHVAFKLIARL